VRGPSIVYLNIGSVHPKLQRWWSAWLHSYYVQKVDCVVAVSEELADEARDLFEVPEERVVVIPNGRDPSVFDVGATQSRSSESTRLIWIGQLDEAKRPEVFLDIIRWVLDLGYDVSGTVVGDGPARDSVEQQAARARVTLLGRRDDVPALLAESDLLVFTGRPPEGMPGVLIEAGLTGLASVSTRVPGAQDVIEDGVTGLLVDVDDLEGLRDSVVTLVQDPLLRSRMGRAARARCLERFTVESTTHQWRTLFDRLRPA
jgi:glycosyltransferase involved in cell wall biosynthesis